MSECTYKTVYLFLLPSFHVSLHDPREDLHKSNCTVCPPISYDLSDLNAEFYTPDRAPGKLQTALLKALSSKFMVTCYDQVREQLLHLFIYVFINRVFSTK